MAAILGTPTPAVRQIIARLNLDETGEKEAIELVKNACRKMDVNGEGHLAPDEFCEVVKMVDGIDISQEELKAILSLLPTDSAGRVKIEDFLEMDIHSLSAFKEIMGQPAMYMILSKKRKRTKMEKKKLAAKIEHSCMKFNNNNGSLSIDDFYHVINVQNKIEVSKDEIKLLVADLDMDEDNRVAIKDFMRLPLIPENVFLEIQNKYGYISKQEAQTPSPPDINAILDGDVGAIQELDTNGDGVIDEEEIKVVKRELSSSEINQLLDEAVTDADGWLSFEEISRLIEKARNLRDGK